MSDQNGNDKAASASGGNEQPRPAGGQGGLLADPHHVRGDMKLLQMAARRRWPVSRSQRKKSCQRLETIIDQSPDDDVVIAAIRTQGVLDGINARREQAAAAEPKVNVTINGGQTGIQIVQREDFYGNAAHLDDAEATVTPSQAVIESGTVQTPSVRPAVGQNGHGTNGSNGRTRTNGRHPEGGN